MELTEDHIEILLSAVTVGGWYVSADNLKFAGALVADGYCTAEDDYGGPQIIPTDKARNALLARGLIRRCEEPWRGWERMHARL